MPSPSEVLAAQARLHPLQWLKHRTPDAVPSPYAKYHHQLAELPKPGTAQLRCVFRGAAKTTITSGMVVHAAIYRRARGILVVCATFRDCKSARQRITRLAQRAGYPVHNDAEQELTVINGVPIWFRSPGGAVRGINWTAPDGEIIRPNFCVIDDLETRETARSLEQTTKNETWLFSDALATAGPEHPMAVIMLGTPITPSCLVAKAMRREPPFDVWEPPVIVPIVDADGKPAWPATFREDTLRLVPPITKATEYDLNPLPEGTLLFPSRLTAWRNTPTNSNMVIAVDPAGGAKETKASRNRDPDNTGIVAMCLTPRGLHIADAVCYKGSRVGMPDKVLEVRNRMVAAGHRVFQVAVEAVGGWEFAADTIADRVDPTFTTCEKPIESKIERALRLTLWHSAGAVTASPHLQGSDWDVEFHSWTQEGQTVTGHDDMGDATVWGGAILTDVWQRPIPTVASYEVA